MSVTYLEKMVNNAKIDIKFHDKFYNDLFMKISSKVELEKLSPYIENIYWLATELYKVSFMKYHSSISLEEGETHFTIEGTAIFNSIATLSSEVAQIMTGKWLFTPRLSSVCRILLETIIFFEEYKEGKIEDVSVFEAAIVSHNKHVGAKIPKTSSKLNVDNPGLFKALDYNVKLNKIARKHHYGWLYNFLSGDNHLVSTIEKIMPMNSDENVYVNLYMKTIQSFLFDVNKIIHEYLGVPLDYDKYMNHLDYVETRINK